MNKPNVRKPVTLKDIANKLGYSANTISRALRDKKDIAPETRAKIRRAADELGYVSNMPASSLRLGYTRTIAVILGDISNPHFAIMMKEIEEHARANGYSTFLINTREDEALEREAIRSAQNKNVDGILLCPVQKTENNVRYLMGTGVPFVLIGRRFNTLPVDYVVCNDELGGFQATSYLLEQGHRDILMLYGALYISSARERLEGYKRAHRSLGLDVRPELVCEVPVTGADCGAMLAELFRKGTRFSAIFAFSDMLAWNVWTCLRSMGYRVPEDFSLVGFDHIQSRLAIPFALSTVSSYKGRMSIAAVDALIGRIRDPFAGGEARTLVIDTRFMPGDTTISMHK